MRAKPVLLRYSALTRNVYAITSYVEKPNNIIDARTKHDVTRDFYAAIFAFLRDNTLKHPETGETVEIMPPAPL